MWQRHTLKDENVLWTGGGVLSCEDHRSLPL